EALLAAAAVLWPGLLVRVVRNWQGRMPGTVFLDALDALTRGKVQALVAELWRLHGCAILLVTHDVEEALLLADRVLVMDEGRIAHEVTVDLPRPRDLTAPEFVTLRARLLNWLGVTRTLEGTPS
ncbi:sulfonate ABC transporter ATP-binding protein, partial [Streptomyces prunicolor]